ncbi:MAG: hypothetical protein AAGE84_09195 [Cyanobacteria bacterium P01_G01_bin.39]
MSQKKTRKLINKIWSTIAIFLLFYSFNTLAIVQWNIENGILPSPLSIFGNEAISRDSILYIGIPVILILLLVLIYLCNLYYENSTKVGDRWNQRVPIFLDMDIKIDKNKVAKNIFVKSWGWLSIISLIIPYLISLQQLYKFFRVSNKAFHLDSGNVVSILHPTSPLVLFGEQYRYGGVDGWTFFPLYIPIFFVVLELLTLFLLCSYLVKIFKHY